MKKLWFYFVASAVILLGTPIAAEAQGGFTTVTGTVKDPSGITWGCGTISAQLITAGGAAPTLNGGGFTTQTSPVQLGCPTIPGSGAVGSFVMRLADSGVISPANTTWKFTVGTSGTAPPLGTGPQSFSYTSAINCGTNTPSTCTSNQMDISTQLSAIAPALGGGGGNISGGATSTPGINAGLAPYSAKFDGRSSQDGVLNSTTTVTSATLSCTAADIGKLIFAVNTGNQTAPFNTTVASCSGAAFVGAAAATATESNDNFVICSDDTTALTNAWNAAIAANVPLILPSGLSCVKARPFFMPNLTPVQQPGQTVAILGAGMNSSVIGMAPSFSWSGANATIFENAVGQTCTLQNSAIHQYTVTTLQDFSVTGFEFGFPAWPVNAPVLQKACQVHRVGIYAMNNGRIIGIDAPSESYIDNNNIQRVQGNGAIGIRLNGGGGTTIVGNILAFANGGGIGISSNGCGAGGGVCSIIGGFTTSNSTSIQVINSTLNAVDMQLSTGSATTGMTVDGTSVVTAARINLVQSGVSTSVGFNVASGGKLNLSQLTYNPSGTPTEITNAGTVFDSCGNNFTGSITNTGSWFGSCSVTGTASAVGNWATTSNWGTTSVNSAVGDSHRTKVSLTTTVTGAASPVLTWTFPTPYAVAPSSCTIIQVGGTFGTITNPVPGTPAVTSVAYTFSGTPTATQTYIFDASCGP